MNNFLLLFIKLSGVICELIKNYQLKKEQQNQTKRADFVRNNVDAVWLSKFGGYASPKSSPSAQDHGSSDKP